MDLQGEATFMFQHGTEQLAWREHAPNLSRDFLHRDVTSEKRADVDAITHALLNSRSGQLAELRERRHLIAGEDRPKCSTTDQT